MKKLFTSTLLAAVAVPFLMAAPNAAKKAQNTATPAANTTTTNKKVSKKHVKKSHAKTAPAPAASTPNQK